MNTTTVSTPLVAAIETVWKSIQDRHEDVPAVVVTLGSGTAKQGMKLGHFAADRWMRGDELVHELFVGGEGLQRGGVGVLGTLLHEAAHGAARAREIQDTSRQGRFHNAKFRAIGEEFGLNLEKDPSIGWSVTTVPADTERSYADEITTLDGGLVAYRLTEMSAGGRKSNNNGVTALCGCGRKIRVSKTVYAAGPISCGLCGSDFEAEDDDE
ncbi:hypothetical protein [Subtercola sp. RTI3]|uniref:hypothetical protein n=1 Tax=Subtercola sp. RTI3 TaxID=3048639 RepID=UPI002B221D9D|nr:hypothetical protein [Subtercola sp. RTI3]MEA9986092.1 hypothetical protein [Subtercola sp. RTI3]